MSSLMGNKPANSLRVLSLTVLASSPGILGTLRWFTFIIGWKKKLRLPKYVILLNLVPLSSSPQYFSPSGPYRFEKHHHSRLQSTESVSTTLSEVSFEAAHDLDSHITILVPIFTLYMTTSNWFWAFISPTLPLNDWKISIHHLTPWLEHF